MTHSKNSKDHGIDQYHGLDREADISGQLNSIYSKWADSYDDDNDNKLKTVSQPNTVAILMRHCEHKAARILDVGCGTGLVGHHLKRNGFTHFDGTDPSAEMMEHARSRGYRNLLKLIPGQPLPATDHSYDATLCVGVFTHGHLGPEGFSELLRVTKPHGLICFTVNEGVWDSGSFAAAIEEYVQRGDWTVHEMSKQDYMVNEDVQAWYICARKTGETAK
ncbi:MAG: class I SAM-dependent methyltransferase [Pseudomonadota bacterium]